MTMNSKRSGVVVGSCPFTAETHDKTVPNNTAQLDGVVCNYAHCPQLCGQDILLLSTPTNHSVSSHMYGALVVYCGQLSNVFTA